MIYTVRTQAPLNLLWQPKFVALFVTIIFSIRFIDCLPFSGNTQLFNTESIAELISFLIYSKEPFSFPIGSIKSLTFPFVDANVGNVGVVPLFAIIIKALGKIFGYFETFDYFVLINIVSCFLTVYFTQKILLLIGVVRIPFRLLGGMLIGTSFLLLNRTAWFQPFCVVAFPLYSAWMFAMLTALQRGRWVRVQDIAVVIVYPLAALSDNYTLVGILMGTAVLSLREVYETSFGGGLNSWNRMIRMVFYLVAGVGFSVIALYVIGMFPLPPIPFSFTSYDFGIGGRIHVADLFSPILPVGNSPETNYAVESLPGRLDFPLTTEILQPGQTDGVAYIGTAALLAWIVIGLFWLEMRSKQKTGSGYFDQIPARNLILLTPWNKIWIAGIVVFIFSLGYELHVLGNQFKNFTGMPAAWISDIFSPLYNIRSPGRLATLLSLIITLEALRRLSKWFDNRESQHAEHASKFKLRLLELSLVGFLAVIHLFEIAPFLRPVPTQPSHPVAGVFSEEQLEKIRVIGAKYDAVLIAPDWREGFEWQTQSFALAYYLNIRSNIFLIARTLPAHQKRIHRDLLLVERGDWEYLNMQYGDNIIFAIPLERADGIRMKLSQRYKETVIGPISIWSKKTTGGQ